jgi:hypothetical protein
MAIQAGSLWTINEIRRDERRFFANFLADFGGTRQYYGKRVE